MIKALENHFVKSMEVEVRQQDGKLIINKQKFPLFIKLFVLLPLHLLVAFILYCLYLSTSLSIIKILLIIASLVFTYYSLIRLINYNVIEVDKATTTLLEKPFPWFQKTLFATKDINTLLPSGEYWVIGKTLVYINFLVLLKNQKMTGFLSFVDAVTAHTVKKSILKYLKEEQ